MTALDDHLLRGLEEATSQSWGILELLKIAGRVEETRCHCYDHYFRRFSPNFTNFQKEKLAVLLKSNVTSIHF
jgi:hypothetical protein